MSHGRENVLRKNKSENGPPTSGLRGSQVFSPVARLRHTGPDAKDGNPGLGWGPRLGMLSKVATRPRLYITDKDNRDRKLEEDRTCPMSDTSLPMEELPL